MAMFIRARSEEAKHNLYVNIQQTNRHNEAAFEGGKEVALLYVADKMPEDLGLYLDNGSPIVENPRPEE